MFVVGERVDLVTTMTVLAIVLAVLMYALQRDDDWATGESKPFVDCLYTSFAIQSCIGYTDGGAASPRMRVFVIFQAMLAYSQVILMFRQKSRPFTPPHTYTGIQKSPLKNV